MSSDPWGRVDETGTVYVRTADGERVVGSWQAGTPEEALAYFERKYEGLVVEIGLLERRVRTTDLAAKEAEAAIATLRAQVDEAHAVGDLEALSKRLDRLVQTVEERREERKARRAKQSEEAKAAKEKLVAEAEELAQSDQWRPMRQAAARAGGHLEGPAPAGPEDRRRAVAPLLARPLGVLQAPQGALRAARRAARGGPQGQGAPGGRGGVAGEVDGLGSHGRPLPRPDDAVEGGRSRAQREHEDALWGRFRGAQDVFFAARGEVFAERDAEQAENLKIKEGLAEEAEKLVPVTDLKTARAAFRAVNERWEAVGHVPRDARPKVEGRMHAVERAIQEAEEAEWRRTNPEARARAAGLTGVLQDAVDKLQGQIERAEAAGATAKAEKLRRELEGRQALLDQARKGLEEFSG